MQRLLIAILMVGSAVAADEPQDSDPLQVTSDRKTYFYTSPTREAFDAIQKRIRSNLTGFETRTNGAALLDAVFLARVYERYNWPLLDLGEIDDVARSIAAKDDSPISRYVQDDSQVDPGKLDIWWVSYFATGDTRYLGNLIAQVADRKSLSGGERILVGGAARWSLSSNCRQHPKVLEYVRSVIAREPPPPNLDALREVLEVTKEKGR